MEITVYNSQQHQQLLIPASGLTLGAEAENVDWCILDEHIEESQCLIRPDTDPGVVYLENHGRSIVLPNGKRVHGGNSTRISIPSLFWIGESCFEVEEHDGNGLLTTLPGFSGESNTTELAALLGKSPAATTLIHWLQSIGTLQRSVGGSDGIFRDAAYAVFDPGGLDSGMILEIKGSDISIASSFISNPELGITFNRQVVEKCIETRETLFHDASLFDDPNCSLRQAVVASPIFDANGKLTAVVYGSRCRHRNNFRQGIRPLEAQFIQVIAECVTAGMVRLAQEADAARTRVQFEQVFSPKLVETLQRDPGVLDGHEREVTVMFCDMRASTIVSERLQPRELYNVLGDVMDHLTDRIMEYDGVVIDYYGDGLAAFWNAPVDQENHAALAVQAALDIIDSLPDLNNNWREYLGRNIQIGIGIHSGVALVGNAGSRRRMKYGPRGRTVNLSSRIENATSQFGVPILISAETRKLIQEKFVTRRICRTYLKGFQGSFELYQPFDSNMDVRRFQLLQKYEIALELFEKGECVEAMDLLVEIEVQGESDNAVEYLIRQCHEQIKKKTSRNVARQQRKLLHPGQDSSAADPKTDVDSESGASDKNAPDSNESE